MTTITCQFVYQSIDPDQDLKLISAHSFTNNLVIALSVTSMYTNMSYIPWFYSLLLLISSERPCISNFDNATSLQTTLHLITMEALRLCVVTIYLDNVLHMVAASWDTHPNIPGLVRQYWWLVCCCELLASRCRNHVMASRVSPYTRIRIRDQSTFWNQISTNYQLHPRQAMTIICFASKVQRSALTCSIEALSMVFFLVVSQ